MTSLSARAVLPVEPDLNAAIERLGDTAVRLADGLRVQRDEARDRVEELEEILRDLVRNNDERSAMGAYPGRAEVWAKAWDRAAEAVGLDDGGEP